MIGRTRLMLLVCAASACTQGDASLPRVRYNDGVAALQKGDWDEAATALLDARDQAGPDPELRYRAAFDLGMAHAGKSESLDASDPKASLAELKEAASWFRDAVHKKPDAKDARANLQLVLARARVLADRMNKDGRGLEARLDRLIEDQRGVRDSIRQLLERGKGDDGGGANALSDEYDAIEVHERTLGADASTVLDLSGDERSLLEQKPKKDRQPKEATRIIQLTNLEHYLASARMDIADTGRLLRKLQGDRAHLRGDAALAGLKRAREQLEDPTQVLRGIAQDEKILAGQTAALAQLGKAGGLTVRSEKPGADGAPAKAPAWLTPEHLGAEQASLASRTGEIRARLEAAAGHDTGDKGTSPEAAKMIQIAKQAAPLVADAETAMNDARSAVLASQLDVATQKQLDALVALAGALERFADLRSLIDIAYATQQQIVALTTPPNDAAKVEMTSAERERALGDAVAQNRDRLERMKGLITEESSKVEAQAAQLAQAQQQAQQQAQSGQAGQTQPGQAPAAPDPKAAQAIQAQKARLAHAEELRGQAATELDALATLLASRHPSPASIREHAETGRKRLEELRKLFFSLIEHLQQLLHDQSETRDRTTTAQQGDDTARAQALGAIAERQNQHAQMGEALAQAIEEQADQAAANASDDKGKEMAKRLADAAPEVRTAAGAIRDAATALTTARDQAQQMSVDLAPPLEDQKTAIDHLEAALKILQPPKPKDQKDQQKKNQGDKKKQDQQKKKQQQKEMSQQEAAKRLQAIRDREAQRQREKNARRQQAPPAPVEKDW